MDANSIAFFTNIGTGAVVQRHQLRLHDRIHSQRSPLAWRTAKGVKVDSEG